MDDMGFGYEAEGTQVSEADPSQYNVAQLPAGGFHYWGVPEPKHIQINNYAQINVRDNIQTCRNADYIQFKHAQWLKLG